MKSRLPHALVAVFAAGAASFAFAQAVPGPTQTPSAEPTATPAATPAWTPSKPPVASTLTFVEEPVASASRIDGAEADVVKSIMDALNADPAMKSSKITVQPDNGTITLTGSVQTREQVKRAGEIASQFAGEGKVINVILDGQT